MRCAGIVAEYNPFHNGHHYHIEQAKKLTGCDHVIVVMSGNYVQRGEPAMFDKFARTRWALMGGADLVLQLPAMFSLSSAERFAKGSVGILQGTGVLDCLCFGSETADIDVLKRAVRITESESDNLKEAMKAQLSLGRSFPRARHNAYSAANIQKDVVHVLTQPNSTLGIEYMRSLEHLCSIASPVIIPRKHAVHDGSELTGSFASASAVRRALIGKDSDDIKDFVPEHVLLDIKSMQKDGFEPVIQEAFSNVILYALRSMTKQELHSLPDVSEGFENVLYSAARSCTSYEKLLEAAKSKRYTLARIKRICMCALLHITHDLQKEALEHADALYLRVLGLRSSAKPLLGKIGKDARLPLIVRASDLNKLSRSALKVFQNDVYCDEVYALSAGIPAVSDFACPLLIL